MNRLPVFLDADALFAAAAAPTEHGASHIVLVLVAALTHGCRYLLTFNVRHFAPRSADIVVLRSGDFLVRMCALMHL